MGADDLERALRSVVRAWLDPGPMGTIYEMHRAVSEAREVLEAYERAQREQMKKEQP